ncbi:hypothetical protein GNI_028300 [Gregarina niphandrodes]|uniref:Uncharacterized protein n=1 Tax=Gregarina niphandrodes TaxID=110365 RepID=A0A023BB51_GRENI|nr:hypothetical protein GNI_028300 [Gregarina niphandrodes]EZG79205.1 hypothetical protein GNI_028300 [Gregarina niphandrodes]|eukprot:XP_011129108.1 hypothetical protein GNI_028300 [Gregarina niphandrodes]
MITVVREVGMDDLTGSGFVQPAVDIQCCPNDSCRRDDIVDRLRQALTIVLTDSEDADSEDAVTDPLCAATDPLCAATDPQDAVVENHSVEGNPLEKDSGNNSGEAEGARVRDVRPDDQGWSDWNEWKKTSPLLNEDLGLLPLDILKKVAVMLGLKSNVGTHILHRAGTRVEDSDRRHLLARK